MCDIKPFTITELIFTDDENRQQEILEYIALGAIKLQREKVGLDETNREVLQPE